MSIPRPLESFPPQVRHLLHSLTFAPLPLEVQAVAERCARLAFELASTLPDSPEVTVGLRKLLEAKDCCVRARLGPAPYHETGAP